jgi:rhodanese-related sulfurtransferase
MPMEFTDENILLVSIVVISGLGLLWPLVFRPVGKAVNPVEATLLINREDARVLDVREPSEFSAGHIAEAINIPAGKLLDRLHEIEKYKDKPLIVCCAAGIRSNKACRQLKEKGFTQLHNLTGGVDAWLSSNYPVRKGNHKK